MKKDMCPRPHPKIHLNPALGLDLSHVKKCRHITPTPLFFPFRDPLIFSVCFSVCLIFLVIFVYPSLIIFLLFLKFNIYDLDSQLIIFRKEPAAIFYSYSNLFYNHYSHYPRNSYITLKLARLVASFYR